MKRTNKQAFLEHDIMLLSLDGRIEEGTEKYDYLLEKSKSDGIEESVLTELIEKYKSGAHFFKPLKRLWCKSQGRSFEIYMAEKLSKDFDIIGWTCDKFVNENQNIDNSLYPCTNYYPDLTIRQKIKPWQTLAIECKWHEKITGKRVDVARKDQLDNYRQFQESKKIPVYIAIGIGNKGMYPEAIYIIPLDKVCTRYIDLEILKEYKINNIDSLKYEVDKDRII